MLLHKIQRDFAVNAEPHLEELLLSIVQLLVLTVLLDEVQVQTLVAQWVVAADAGWLRGGLLWLLYGWDLQKPMSLDSACVAQSQVVLSLCLKGRETF